ncbi:MAG: ABC transporter permease [Rhodobacteraceae bacterium]|nr:ABC transporter permease [Paracoccaceae bacterium]
MTRAALGALLSHWRRKPFQLVTLLVGLALATALWSGVQAINAEARASYDRAAAALGETRFARIARADGGMIAQETYVALRRAGWLVSPILEDRAEIGGASLRLVGFDPLTAPPSFLPGSGPGGAGGLAGFITPPGQVIVASGTAEDLSPEGGPEIVTVEGLAPGIGFTDIGIAQRLLQRPGQISHLILLPGQPMGRPDLQDIAPGLEIRPPAQSSDIARLTDSFHLNLTAFGLLSFAVGLFIVHGAVGLAFEQRRPVFRTLRALGLPLRRLLVLLVAELLIFALIAGAIGVSLGYVIAAALLPDVAATLRGLYGASVEGTLSLRPSWWIAGLGISVIGTGAAAAQSLWKVARMPLLAPARARAWALQSERALWAQGGAVVACLAVAAGAAAIGGLVASFTLLGALLIAAALSLPILLHLLLGLAARLARAPVTEWFWADTRQQLPGLSLALMALLLALSANIGVGTMVGSFRLTFTGWLDQRLVSDLYITARDEAEGQRLEAYLADKTDAILPIWSIKARVAGWPAEIYGVADNPIYPRNWPLLEAAPDVWEQVHAGTGALINEQLMRREGLAPGDRITLPGPWSVPVAGIYSDYGNSDAQIVIALDQLTSRYPEAERLDYGLLTDDPAGLARSLRDDFGLPAENMVDQASLKAFSLSVFERTFAVTGALNVLTLAIAGFAILTSLLTLATMRQPQLAPVWALGLTRAQLARIELGRALMLAALTFVLALPVGILLAWVLLNFINVDAFGWRLPMWLFPRDWLWLGLLSLLAAGLAALWPARRLARTPPADLLRIFANER